MRRRFWFEAALASGSGFFFLLTLATREWIEALTRWDPDGGNGSVEWLVVLALLAATVLFGLIARAEYLRSPHLEAS
jgi:hypothetical protein